MAPRSRIIAFGSCAALVVAGSVCAVLVDGLAGRILSAALVTLGFGGAILLVFLEVGLSEDRELEREEERRRRRRHGLARPRSRHGSPRSRRRP